MISIFNYSLHGELILSTRLHYQNALRVKFVDHSSEVSYLQVDIFADADQLLVVIEGRPTHVGFLTELVHVDFRLLRDRQHAHIIWVLEAFISSASNILRHSHRSSLIVNSSTSVHSHFKIACLKDRFLNEFDYIDGVFSSHNSSQFKFCSSLWQTD